jgi:GTP-binding protein EngB required for normal cell division
VEILCLQETEIDPELDTDLVSLPGFGYESETNSIKSRVGCFIKAGINYNRCYKLKGVNSHQIIIDVMAEHNLRIINIYRTFSPQNG